MADINNFSMTGRLTQDATYRTLASGKGVLTCNVAINSGYGDYKKTLFVKVQQWGERGQKLASYLTKGKPIACVGELSRNEWDSKEGNHNVEFVVDTVAIQLIGSMKQDTKSSDNTTDSAAEEEFNF